MAAGPAANGDPGRHPHLVVGTPVEVRSQFDGGWCHGFEVAEVVDSEAGVAFRLRRVSDGTTLPTLFPAHEVYVAR